ncbi:uncharacterized protein At2g39910 isoform X2 [Malania oleifera]|uniref:uncharacterized protein At2g39910 isoform X2 n=1 Tax=Malania oleifera TaxID=397392 RepID=UPI0025AE526D|nr:uncharacterized protein At2g39910 isoform X2 [Malania oleifera]
MSNSLPTLRRNLIRLSEPIRESLQQIQYTPPEGSNISIKSMLESLLPRSTSPSNDHISEEEDRICSEIKDFSLCCAALASSEGSTHEQLSWIPKDLSFTAASAFRALSEAFFSSFDSRQSKRLGELGMDHSLVSDEKKLVVELMPEVLPSIKASIKESSIDASDEAAEISAASARVPVAYAIVAAYQFRWFATQVEYPHLGKLCSLVIPCALTALDHWSPEVKNVNAAELGWYEDVVLDACCQNIASNDEIWQLVVEMSVLLVTCIQRSNPRSPWFERMLNEMFSHLERQPRNKERRIEWLEFVEPLFHGVGLVLLAHFRRIFPLFFQWMHADDDHTVVLVLKRLHTVIKLTWIRSTSYIERLVDELAVIYKEAALRKAREEIRTHILQILTLLRQCKGRQFEAAWDKHRDDPNLTTLGPSFCARNAATILYAGGMMITNDPAESGRT